MRKELEIIQTIEKYLQGKMSAEEKNAFEAKLNTDKKLQEEVKLQLEIMEGLKGVSLKMKAKKAYKKYSFGKAALKAGLITGGTIVLLAAGYFGYKALNKDKANDDQSAYVLPELNENGEKIWADADKYLPYQKFTIHAQKDTVVETEDGIVMAIPANCFLDKNGKPAEGEITLEVKEAIEPNDIMKAGLNTKSGDQLLETGGMFYINARKGDESLAIDPKKGVYAEVPTDEVNPDMQLFEGKRMPDGSIDWVNPKPIEKFLVPVSMNTLNFYPPEYEDSLAAMGKDVNNKIYKDSLYYSFARLFSSSLTEPLMDIASVADTTNIDELTGFSTYTKMQNSGEVLFRKNCAACHHPTMEVVGPPLKGAKQRWSNAGIPDKIYQWINNPKRTLDAGYPYVKNLVKSQDNKGIVLMPPQVLTREEINAILNYADNEYMDGINPSKIKAIWNKKFENTLIATREFEERCQLIHRTCNNAVLDVYVNNLDKKMCTLDSMAARISGNAEFYEFAKRKDGRVKTEARHLYKLKKYYEEKTRIYTEAVANTEREFWQKNDKLDNEASQKSVEQSQKDFRRNADNFQKELNLNMVEAYRQVGKPLRRGNVNGVTVVNTGWKNIDAYVLESTIARTTLDYTDPESGKKAVIKYEALEVSVSHQKDYDVVYAYLIPDKLNSFMRMPEKDGGFKENLNELIKYQLVVMAYKGRDIYMNVVGVIQPGKMENISLEKTPGEKVDQQLRALKNFGQRQQLLDEAAYRYFEMKTRARQKHVESITKFRERIQGVIFPCSNTPADTTSMMIYPAQ